MPLVVGTITSWKPPPVRSAVTGEPMTWPLVVAAQTTPPLVPLRAYTVLDVVPSMTSSCPLPWTLASAGESAVMPLSVWLQARPHPVLMAKTLLLSERPAVEAPVADGDADATAGKELADCRRGAVDVLVGVVLADEATGRVEGASGAGARDDADVPAVAVGLAVGAPGARVTAADDLVVAVGVEVGQGGRREHRVSGEPREPAEHRAVARAEGVGVLAEVAGLDAVAAGVVANGQRRRDARVRHRIGAGLVDPTNHWSPPPGEMAW